MFSEIRYSTASQYALCEAQTIASKCGSSQVTSLHLLYGLTKNSNSTSANILNSFGVTSGQVWSYLLNNSSMDRMMATSQIYSMELQEVLNFAFNISRQIKENCVGSDHLLYAILGMQNSKGFDFLSQKLKVNVSALKDFVLKTINNSITIRKNENQKITMSGRESCDNDFTNCETNSQAIMVKELSQNIKDLGVDLNQKVIDGKIGEIIGRDDEMNRAIEILCRKTKNNPVFIGEPGVGKSAVAEGIAKRIVEGNVPDLLKDKIVFSLDIASLVSNTKYRGTMEAKLKSFINAVLERKDIIVFIDELHTLVQASSESGEISPVDILKPYLARGEIQTMGATTTQEFTKYIEADKALERRFQPIQVNEPTKNDCIAIIKGIKNSFEKFHGVEISNDAIETAVVLSDRYITDRNLPDKAIDLIDEASSHLKISTNKEIVPKITSEDIALVVSKWTGVPVTKLSESESQKLKNLEDIIHKRVIGQNEAVSEVCKALKRARIGLGDEKKPIGSFLFLGQTGVGKTELCKALASAMFDSEKSLIKIDMSEYMEPHSVSKLIGAPPGYVGHDDGGQLTDAVKKHPYSVVLFDEVEKAHPDVLNIMLQLLDEGRLTDSKGTVVNFKNTIIIVTSNIGASEIEDNEPYESQKTKMLASLKRTLKAELINRFDGIVVFHSLTENEMAKICIILINNLNKRLKSKNIELKLTESSFRYIVEKGSDRKYGARPLKRFIINNIEDVIADKLLNGEIGEGSTLVVNCVNNELEFKEI